MDGAARNAVQLAMTARRMIALTVAYAVALQAMLSGFVVPAVTAGPAGEICVPAANAAPAAAPVPGAPHPMLSDCLACPAMCGTGLAHAPGVMPVGLISVPSVEPRPTQVVLRTEPRLLPPSRAPPAA
jgi:hypothetical protein